MVGDFILMPLRITVSRIHIGILYATMALNIYILARLLFFTIFQCTPINHFWNRMS